MPSASEKVKVESHREEVAPLRNDGYAREAKGKGPKRRLTSALEG